MTNKDHIETVISYLTEKLKNNQPTVRAKAAEALGNIGLETGTTGLLLALKDSN